MLRFATHFSERRSLIELSNYKLDDISRYYKDCKPEIKPIALEIVKKLASIK